MSKNEQTAKELMNQLLNDEPRGNAKNEAKNKEALAELVSRVFLEMDRHNRALERIVDAVESLAVNHGG